jgi:thiol-disulfide isomerase/thioredoxin
LFITHLITSINSFSQSSFQITGKIVEGRADYLYLSRLNFWYFLPHTFDSIKINPDNSFSKNLIVSDEAFFIYHQSKNLGLIFPKTTRGALDSIRLTVNLANLEFIIDDTNKEQYDDFYDYQRKYRVNGGFDSAFKSHLKLNSSDFINVLKKEYEKRNKEIEASALKFASSPYFIHYLTKTNYYEFYCKLYDYLLNHYYFLNKELDYYPQDDLLSKELSKMKLYEEDIRIPEFGYLLKFIINNAYDSLAYQNKDTESKVSGSSFKFEYVKNRFENYPQMRDLGLTFVIKDLIDHSSNLAHFNKADSLINQINFTPENELYIKFIKNYYLRKKPSHAKIDFRLKDSSKSDFVLSSLKDKIVVLFFWGTWCAPCKKQIPFLNKTIKELENREDIVFINVGLETNNFENWKNSLSKYNMQGINLYAEGNLGCKELTAFNLTFAPRVVIIRNGKIVLFNAPLPENNLKSELLKL